MSIHSFSHLATGINTFSRLVRNSEDFTSELVENLEEIFHIIIIIYIYFAKEEK